MLKILIYFNILNIRISKKIDKIRWNKEFMILKIKNSLNIFIRTSSTQNNIIN